MVVIPLVRLAGHAIAQAVTAFLQWRLRFVPKAVHVGFDIEAPEQAFCQFFGFLTKVIPPLLNHASFRGRTSPLVRTDPQTKSHPTTIHLPQNLFSLRCKVKLCGQKNVWKWVNKITYSQFKVIISKPLYSSCTTVVFSET